MSITTMTRDALNCFETDSNQNRHGFVALEHTPNTMGICDKQRE